MIGNAPLQKGSDIPLFVVDWEMAHLGHRYVDFGQMLAEMYAIWQYRKMEAGLWLVQGFCQGLNLEDENLAFRIAAQVGCHLVACDAKIPSWGTPDQQEECARAGRDFIVHARKRERDWFDESDLACLFARV